MADEGAQTTGSRAEDTAGSVFTRTAPVATTPDFGKVREGLGELGKDKAFEPIKDFQGWAKSFIDSQKLLGKPIRLPEKEKKEERKKAIDGFMNHLRTEGDIEAIPEAPEKYEIKLPQEEGFKPNEPLLNSFKQFAHKTQMPPSMAQAAFDWYLNFQAEADALEQEKFQEVRTNLKKEWAGLYVRHMEAARRAGGKYLGPDADQLFSQIPPEIGVRFVKAFAEIGDPLIEDALVSGELVGIPQVDEVRKKIVTMMNDKDHPLNDVSKAGHKEAVEELTKLNEQLTKLGGKI